MAMNKIVFTEEFCTPENLFPFTLTRQVQDIRIGILTIREKWEKHLQLTSFDKFEDDYKDRERAIKIGLDMGEDVFILLHGNVLPTKRLVRQIKKLKHGEFLSVPERESVAYCISKKEIVDENRIKVGEIVELDEELKEIKYPWDIFRMNDWAIREDFDLITGGRKGQKIPESNKVSKASQIFIEKGAIVEDVFLNASEGPIYIGKDALIMEGSMLRGPISIGENAVVKMGSKIYGATTIGPGCTVGGEVKNVVFFGNSNKAHDGYIGDSVIGEWCNIGAGTSNSNIKNTASEVIVYTPRGPRNVGVKCGVIMGDYSRTAINTSINTGTVIGVCANVYGIGLTPKYIPCFSWGTEGVERYKLEKAFSDINNWKDMKGSTLTETEKSFLKHIFDHY
jgi:UDP-N-acetylglucosamine diphosphorylase / glucose-1-phosphate thymidylyltransferase / UDP-N-acetylgalactosamine diphosphorylase / glucosamine-1-phosphate N-acetyltransferase / galactosamine-1-phosphate N-acetyltransferase